MANAPRVSVCIPTYNYGRYLPETVASVLAQSFADFELLVIDDCSGDDTAEVGIGLAAQDPRITFSVNSRNRGMVANWNHCLELARGEYVRFLFGDDLLADSDALGQMVAILDREPRISLVSSARNVIDEESRVVTVWSTFSNGVRLPGGRVMARCLYEAKNLVGEPSVVMFRKEQALRGFNPAYRQLVDLEMWFHLLEKGDFAYLDTPLTSFRVHERQQSLVNCYQNVSFDDYYLLLQDYLGRPCFRDRSFLKLFTRYDLHYRTWKAWKVDGIMDQQAAYAKIRSSSSLVSFYLFLPLYKLFKPLVKLRLKFQRFFL